MSEQVTAGLEELKTVLLPLDYLIMNVLGNPEASNENGVSKWIIDNKKSYTKGIEFAFDEQSEGILRFLRLKKCLAQDEAPINGSVPLSAYVRDVGEAKISIYPNGIMQCLEFGADTQTGEHREIRFGDDESIISSSIKVNSDWQSGSEAIMIMERYAVIKVRNGRLFLALFSDGNYDSVVEVIPVEAGGVNFENRSNLSFAEHMQIFTAYQLQSFTKFNYVSVRNAEKAVLQEYIKILLAAPEEAIKGTTRALEALADAARRKGLLATNINFSNYEINLTTPEAIAAAQAQYRQ